MMTVDEMVNYDIIVEHEIATPEELNLAFNLIGGSWTNVLNAVVYIRTGYRSLEQYLQSEMEEGE